MYITLQTFKVHEANRMQCVAVLPNVYVLANQWVQPADLAMP
jgi:hypothetical protein